MPYYEFPNITHGMEDLFVYSNTVTDNYFSLFIIIGTFFVLFLSMKRAGIETEKAFASTSFSTTLVTYIMVLIPGFISPEIIVIMTMISAISLVFLYKTGSKGTY